LLVCHKCNCSYSADLPRWSCDCGGVLDLDFQPSFDIRTIANRRPTMWRYREAFPINQDTDIVSMDEGFTSLLEIAVGGKRVLIKQEQLFSTGSYKDRGASVLISKIRELGITEVVEDSSGNAGSAIAAYCARAGIKCHIYVPAKTSPAKLAQIRSYGAKLNLIPGSRENTAEAALLAAENLYYASHSWNPFFLQGTKTFAYEVCEQLGWGVPDTIVLPIGNGTLLLGASIGFDELKSAGVIKKTPKLIAVQAANCAPLYEMFSKNLNNLPSIEVSDTIAEGIAVAKPVRGLQILDAVRQSGGHFITVSDNEIKQSLEEMCSQGFYIEPTAAATIAGLEKYLGRAESDELIVSAFTGHGLKATEKFLN